MRPSHLILSALLALSPAVLLSGSAQAQQMTSPSTTTTTTTTETTTSTQPTTTTSTVSYTNDNVPQPEDSLIDIQDQYVADGKLKIKTVNSPSIGYLVIYDNNNGLRGDILGYTPIEAGANKDLSVSLSRLPKNNRGFAVVHVLRNARSNNVLGRFDPTTFPPAQSPKSAIAAFNVYPYQTGYADPSATSVSSASYSSTTTTTTTAPSDALNPAPGNTPPKP
ncbi:DUF7282 domain-containing protein [Gloeobacter kilaueensis]|uniref:DUF7282 domain-containing protein n=1 Tax=Gloeobacter kilaueensis (strain ATCC BAA-2537 / CCAP 1431/1 / ULC 316 / JS1) TaxID=1183438 RepID=U5QL41_GLOK1|nr:hypothetical protein [Gloeobacter kilaueensis]AGY58375.1 hypothetical protein GKIL_2129 [Gloeobacter kilaueensis JS1]